VDISKRNLGKALPNTPLLSAVTRLTGIIEKERFFADMQSAFAAKFKTKPEVIEGNMNALKDAWVGAVRVA
jgi:pyruvate ferredoxin oxidoreductase gamma subunit